MADVCVSAIKSCAIRMIRVDSCGRPVVGPKSVIVSKGYTSIGASADVEEGEEFLVKNACGELCINEKDCSILKRLNLTVNFCKIDFGAVEMTTSQRLLVNDTGGANGFTLGETVQCDDGWSLEVWQKIAGAQCDVGGERPWLYWAYPNISNGMLGDLTFENGPFQFDLTAMTRAVTGDNIWGLDNRGPFQVLDEGQGFVAGEHAASWVTTVQPPTDVCGYLPLVADPDVVEGLVADGV